MRPHAVHIAMEFATGKRARWRLIACEDSIAASAFSVTIEFHWAADCGVFVRCAITGAEASIIFVQLAPSALQAA